MGIVTHANTFYTGWGKLLFDAEECVLAGVLRHVKQLVFDAQELVVLRHAVRAARRTGLDLAGVDGNGDVRDRGVLGLAGAVRDDGRPTGAVRHLDGVERLGQRANLVELDEHRVGCAELDALFDALDVRDLRAGSSCRGDP